MGGGEFMESSSRKVLREESRNSGTFLSGSQLMKVKASLAAFLSPMLLQLSRAERCYLQISTREVTSAMLPVHV